MFKKFIFISLMSMVALLTLTGCGNSDDNSSIISTTNGSTAIVSSADGYSASTDDGYINSSDTVSSPLNGVGDIVSDIGEGISSVL